MRDHPEPDQLIELARSGAGSAAQRRAHAHCLVCDDCREVVETVQRLRGLFERPVAPLAMPAVAAGVQ